MNQLRLRRDREKEIVLKISEKTTNHGWGQGDGYVEITIIESEDNIHLEKILEYLQKAGSLLEEQGAGYYVMALTLQNGEFPNDTVTLEIFGVKKEDLEAEDPLARLREMWEAQEAHREQVRQGWED